MAGYTAATKIDTLAMLPNMNFSNAMSSYTAQNIGARRDDRVPVSYTHLDVYKRQPMTCPRPFPLRIASWFCPHGPAR